MNQKDAERRRKGRLSRKMGQKFEERIEEAFAYYRQRGFAHVDKNQEPMRVLKRLDGGKFIACFTKKAQADFKGTIKGGRTVVYEAKFTASEKLEQSVVDPNQTEYLDFHNALGARCYVIAGYASGAVYLIPWVVWKNMKERFGRKYVKEDDLEPYKVRESWNGVLMLII